MIALLVRREWKRRNKAGKTIAFCTGLYLLGFIPLYISAKEPQMFNQS